MNTSFRKQNRMGDRAQAIVEFAIVVPVLVGLLIGIFEAGRAVFIYAAVNNASREAVRYASAVGLDDDGLNHYNNCAGIRNIAKRSAYFMSLQDSNIAVAFDGGPGTTSRNALCNGTDAVATGDRVTVTVTASYRPMIRLFPIAARTITSTSSRTILGILEVEN